MGWIGLYRVYSILSKNNDLVLSGDNTKFGNTFFIGKFDVNLHSNSEIDIGQEMLAVDAGVSVSVNTVSSPFFSDMLIRRHTRDSNAGENHLNLYPWYGENFSKIPADEGYNIFTLSIFLRSSIDYTIDAVFADWSPDGSFDISEKMIDKVLNANVWQRVVVFGFSSDQSNYDYKVQFRFDNFPAGEYYEMIGLQLERGDQLSPYQKTDEVVFQNESLI